MERVIKFEKVWAWLRVVPSHGFCSTGNKTKCTVRVVKLNKVRAGFGVTH